MFKQQIRSIYSFVNMFLLVFQSFMPGIFAFLPTQAYAQDKQDVKSVALEFFEESNEFELSVVAESEVSYVLSYEDEQGVTKGITGVAQVKDGVARATEYAGTCSSDLKCVPDSFEKGTLELPKAEYKSDFVVADAGLWLVSGAVATISSVDLGVEYVAPQNDGVRVQFTKLPKTSGNLRIEEIKLSDEQVKELGAYSNVAYDISSDMPDGSFEYKLQLPLPEGADENSQLVYAESIAELNTAQKIESGEIVSETMVAEGLDHFTVFVVTFEAPNYATGNINGQDGWLKTGPFDAEVDSSYGYSTFDGQSLRISNAITSGSFGDQTFVKPLADAVGEIDATSASFSEGNRQTHFEMQFDIASTMLAEQPGMFISVSPDRGDGSRMSYLSFSDTSTGILVTFYDVQGENAGYQVANFVPTVLGELNRSVPHTIKLVMDVVDGPSNDIVKVYIDGLLVHTGTSWENYYRFDTEASAEQSPRIVKTLIFRTSGVAVPANIGKGYLFDNISLLSESPIPDVSGVTFVGSPKYVRENNGSDLAAQIKVPSATTEVNFIVDGNTSSPVNVSTVTAGAPAGFEWYRLRTPLSEGEHTITAQIKIGGVWYDVAPTATVYSLNTPWFEYQHPQSGIFYRPTDGFARIRIDDEFNQVKNVTFALYTDTNSLIGNYTVNRAECDLRSEGNYLICDLMRDYSGVLPVLSGGNYYLKLQTQDFAGGGVRYTHGNSKSVTFTIDAQAPVVHSIQSAVPASIFTHTFTAVVDATDDIGLASVDVYYTEKRFDGQCDPNMSKIDQKTVATPELDGKYHATFNTATLNGEYCFFAVAEDLANSHSNPQQGKAKFVFDNTAPSKPTWGTIYKGHGTNPQNEISCNSITNTTQVTFEWNPNTESDLKGYWFGTKFNSKHQWIPAGTTVKTASMTPGNNPYYYTIIAVDTSDNESVISEQCGLTLDQDVPVTTLTSPTPGSTNQAITIAGSSTDLNKVASVALFYSVAGQNNWQPITIILNTTNSQPFAFSYAWIPSVEGIYDIKASGTDMAGNVENSAYVYGVTYDTTAPTAPGLDTPIDGFKTKGVAFTQKWFSVSDAVSYEYQSCNTDPGDVSDSCSSVKFTQTFNGVNNTTKSVGAGQPNSHFWWRVRAKDSANNWSNWSESRELIIDNSAPTTVWDSLASTYFSATPVLTGVGTDVYLAGIANVTYRVENTSDATTVFDWQSATPSDGTFNGITEDFVTNLSSLADGAYTFLARSIDQVGNQGVATEVDLIVDTIAPDVAVTTPVAGLLSGTVPIRGTVTDVNPHHYWFVIQNSGGTVVAGPGTVNESNSFTDQLLLNWNTTGVADGIYTIKLEARDSAENKDAGSVSWVTVTVDNTAPVTTLSTPVTDQKSNQAIEIAGNSTDTNGVNFVNLYYSVADADSWTLIDTIDNTVDSTSFDFSYDWTPAEGKYDIKVEATDVLGNVEHTAYAYDVIYDVTDPSSEITTFDLGDGEEIETTTFDGLLEGTATDLPTDIASGVDHVLLSISHLGFGEDESNTKYWDATGSAWVSEQSLFSATSAETWSYQLSDTPEGFYTVVSHAVDKAGNVEDTYTIKIVYDKTIPEVNLTIDPTNPNGNNGWYKTLPTITLTANDNYFVDHIEYQWNSTVGSWTTYSAPITPPGEGQNILYYRAVDTVGNVSGNGIKEVKFDKTEPANGPLNVRVENIGSVEALGKWDKPNGDEQVHEYRVSWRHPVSGTEYSDFVSASTFEHKLVNLFDGVWEFKVQLLDAAGNNKEATAQFRVGSDPSAVLGATTDQNIGTGTGGTFFNTQQVSQEDEVEDAGSAEEKTEAEAAGTVLGESDDTCAPWQFYLPLFLLLIQALLAISLEFINKELSAKKLLFAILISGLMIGAFYMLRDPSCYSGGSVMQSLAKFFVPLSLLLAFVLRVIGSLTVEEK